MMVTEVMMAIPIVEDFEDIKRRYQELLEQEAAVLRHRLDSTKPGYLRQSDRALPDLR